MIKVVVIEEFTLGKFKELKNIVRYNPNKNQEGKLYVKDTFECNVEMVEYLTKTNAKGRPFVEVIEVIPEEDKTAKTLEIKALEVKDGKVVPKKTTKKATTKKTTKK